MVKESRSVRESRGGGYDLAEEKRLAEVARKRKAFRSESRQERGRSVGMPGEVQEAPTSVGEVMASPSFGREAPAGNDEEMASRVSRNKQFLMSPEARAQLFQFGAALLGGGNMGQAITSAVQLPSRMRKAKAEATNEERKAALEERKLQIQEAGLGLDVAKAVLEREKFEKGEKPAPTEITKLLDEADTAEAENDFPRAAALRSRAFQLSQEFSLQTGQVYVPSAGGGGGGNVGIAPSRVVSGESGGVGNIVNVPGGEADLKAKEAMDRIAADKGKELQAGLAIGNAVDSIEQIVADNIAPGVLITGLGGLLQYIPVPTDAGRVSGHLTVLQSRAGFEELQAMRDASKTGGALGQVTEWEHKLLQSVNANLQLGTLDKNELLTNIRTIKFLFNPSYIEKRNQLSVALRDKHVTTDEAINTLNMMYREAVFGPEGKTINLTNPPDYIEERFKEMWSIMTPEEKKLLLNEEDKQKVVEGEAGAQ